MSSSNRLTAPVSEEVRDRRAADHEITPVFLNRWSPRAFSDRPVSDEDLNGVLEAARWAPSSNNEQPWRFVVARTPEHLAVFHQFLNPSNQVWASRAPALVLVASSKQRGNGSPNGAHAFDAGTAWGYMTIEAAAKGLWTHAMGGFNRDEARRLLNLPDHFEPHAVMAIGYKGDPAQLPEGQRERERPNGRRPLAESVYEGKVT